jgi:hypothetical protein
MVVMAEENSLEGTVSPETAEQERLRHDQCFKELISTFFLEFLELFVPELAALVEPDSVRFLQQEYFTDVLAGEKKIIDQPNPVAAALMSKMKITPEDRPKVKAECLRLLVTLKLDPAKMSLVSKFVDTYLQLDREEEKTFQAEVDRMDIAQKEEIMQVTTSWERKGIEQGKLEGKLENQRSLAKPLEENRTQHAQRKFLSRADLSFDRDDNS